MPSFGGYVSAPPWLARLAMAYPGTRKVFPLPAPPIGVPLVEEGFYVFVGVRLVYRIPSVASRLHVEEDSVVYRAVAFGAAVRTGPLPHYLALEVGEAENLIHHDLEVVARVPIAMQVE